MSDLPFGNIFGESLEPSKEGVSFNTTAPIGFGHTDNNTIPSSSFTTQTPPATIQGFGAGSISTLQGFGAPKPPQLQSQFQAQTLGALETADDIVKDEEFKLEAIFGEGGIEIGIGAIKRIVPIGEWLLDEPAVKALKRNLDDMGITQVMPMVYANRVKHNIEKGYVQPDGSGFTEKGQQRAAEYLQYRHNQSSEEAMKRASEAKSVKIDQKRGDKARGLNLKFGFGYQLDTAGRALRH